MDSLAHLALMTKAQLVFGAADTFLSFPALSPLSYPPDHLNFTNSTTLTAEQLRSWAEFCQVTNSLPVGTIFQPPSDTYLWDKYHEVLTTRVLAAGELSTDQQAALAAAQAYLRVTTPDGLQIDSPALIAYKQYRDAWFKAVQDYKEQQLTASASTDLKQQAQWANTDEPALRAHIAEAEGSWESKGNKAAVEQAQQVETAIAAQSPQLRWADWSSQFIPDIDLQTDPGLGPFGLTGFVPSDAAEQKDWPAFTLTAFEIGRLVGQAPKELAAIFGELPSTSEIESISFEYRSVGLKRPWLRPELFGARFWKLPDASRQLSDGGDPPQGEWPAYITAIVFARNIVLQIRTTSAAAAPVQLRALPSIAQRLEFVAEPGAGSASALRPVVATVPVALHLPPAATPSRPAVMLRAPAAMQAAATPTVHAASLSRAATVAIAAPVTAPTVARVVRLNPALITVLNSPQVVHPIGPPHPVTPPPPPPAPAPPAQPQPQVLTDVSILAFICKRLPKCPNPDPALKW